MDYKRIRNATMQFKVENSWIDNNSLSADNIKMSTWDNTRGKWTELLTTTTNKDDTYTYFDSRTNTFSSFAISGIKAAPIATATATADLSTPSAIAIVSTQGPVATVAVASKGSKSLQILIVVIIIVVIFYVLRLKKS
jgi:hypothetical protein